MNKEYYQLHKERMIASVRKYQKTRKGMEVVRKALEKRRRTDPDYFRKYMQNWRKKKESQGLCINCGRNPAKKNHYTCEGCLLKFVKYYAKIKKERESL